MRYLCAKAFHKRLCRGQMRTAHSPPLPTAQQAEAALLERGFARESSALLPSCNEYGLSVPVEDRVVDGLSL